MRALALAALLLACPSRAAEPLFATTPGPGAAAGELVLGLSTVADDATPGRQEARVPGAYTLGLRHAPSERLELELRLDHLTGRGRARDELRAGAGVGLLGGEGGLALGLGPTLRLGADDGAHEAALTLPVLLAWRSGRDVEVALGAAGGRGLERCPPGAARRLAALSRPGPATPSAAAPWRRRAW